MSNSSNRFFTFPLLMALSFACWQISPSFAALRHEYNFVADGSDSVGSADLQASGTATFGGGVLTLPGGAPRTNNAAATGAALTELAGTINGTDSLSVVVRYNSAAAQDWSKVFMAGDPGGEAEPDLSYLDITPQRGGGQNFGTTLNDNTAGELGVNGLPLVADNVAAIAVAIYDEFTDTITLHSGSDGDLTTVASGSTGMGGRDLANVTINEFYLGSAVNFGDQDFNGTVSQFQLYDHALTTQEVQLLVNSNPDSQLLTLEVNKTSGATRLVNNTPSAQTFSYYEVNSFGGALNAAGWNSLSDQNIDAIGGGPGQTWDESVGSDTNLLSELFLLGDTSLAPGAAISLGTAFHPTTFGGQDGDLTFAFSNDAGPLVNGFVKYVMGGGGLACDSNADGDCDQDDIDAMYAAFGSAGQFDYSGNGTVGGEDINGWLADASSSVNTANPLGKTYVLGDANLDGNVNSTDLGLLLNNFNSTGGVTWDGGDLNGDNNVNSTDLGQLLNNFNFTSAAAMAVPEPHGMALVMFALLGFAARGRKKTRQV